MLIDEPTTILDGTTVLGVIIFQRGCCMVWTAIVIPTDEPTILDGTTVLGITIQSGCDMV
jgi:ABC-type ATPase involved in cell division